jgi:hypothetical protein
MTDEEFHDAIMRKADELQAAPGRMLPRDLAEDVAYILLCTETGLSVKKVEINEELNEFLRPGVPDPVEFPNGGGER